MHQPLQGLQEHLPILDKTALAEAAALLNAVDALSPVPCEPEETAVRLLAGQLLERCVPLLHDQARGERGDAQNLRLPSWSGCAARPALMGVSVCGKGMIAR